MTHEQFIEPKTAKLAKQAGFDLEVNSYLSYYGNCPDNPHWAVSVQQEYKDWNNYKFKHILEAYSAPTQSVLQRWLREVKNVVLLVDFDNDEDCEENERYGVTIYTGKERIVELATYPTYEEALEAGLQNYLTNLLKESRKGKVL